MTQQLLVLLVVAAAALFLGHRAWRKLAALRPRRAAGGCGGTSCGCGH